MSKTKTTATIDEPMARARSKQIDRLVPAFQTGLGKLYQADCVPFLKTLDPDSVDLIFADPPFNLNKQYPSQIDDNIQKGAYIDWMYSWLTECVRILSPGGSLFVWNLPRWNMHAAVYLDQKLTFRHWITVDIKYSLPISGRLYPSHYGLLYFCKGKKPRVFHPDRLPMPVCPSCHADLRDYGGYKDRMNPLGVNLPDVWTDIPPVRHAKYKRRQGANELPLKLLDRIIEMASDEEDLVLDPFGGSGTTYVASELKARRWIGVELGPLDDIIRRFQVLDEEREYLQRIRAGYNQLFVQKVSEARAKKGLWTVESVRSEDSGKQSQLPLDLPTSKIKR
jgi:site-specific DNA-methyltransferase (adenine-specific)